MEHTILLIIKTISPLESDLAVLSGLFMLGSKKALAITPLMITNTIKKIIAKLA